MSFLIGAGGCTTSSHKDRGSLSDAMDKARDDHEDKREVPDKRDDPPPYERDRDEREDNEDTGNSYIDKKNSSYGDPLGDLRIMLRGGQGFINGPYFHSGLNGEILLGGGENKGEIYVLAGLKTLTTREDHDVSLSIKRESFMVHAGVEGRFYPFPSLSFFSPHVLGRLGGFYYLWSYMNPLTAGSDTIHSDSVGGAFLGVGAGLDLLHTDFFRLGALVIPEVYLFGEETSQGFHNDYFSAQGTVKWSIEGGWQF